MLKTLPAWLSLRFLIWMQQKMTAPRIRAAPTSDPITMPAMAPPESPDPDPALPLPDGVGDEVPVGKTGGIETVVGSLRPEHRASTLALTQQESVELTVLSPQNMQSPCKLPWYPHSLGSFCTAAMQPPLSASDGLEQRAKSDLISAMALFPAVPHS